MDSVLGQSSCRPREGADPLASKTLDFRLRGSDGRLNPACREIGKPHVTCLGWTQGSKVWGGEDFTQ